MASSHWFPVNKVQAQVCTDEELIAFVRRIRLMQHLSACVIVLEEVEVRLKQKIESDEMNAEMVAEARERSED